MEEFSGTVTHVYDGDTLEVLEPDGEKHRIRLASIDTPELAQQYGQEAKELLQKLALHKLVRVEVKDVDKYDREVARIYTESSDGMYFTDIADLMLIHGAAWHTSYYDKDDPLCDLRHQLQLTARTRKVGLWQNLTPVPPWVWRKNHPRN